MYGGGTERIALNLHENLPKEYNTSLLTLYNTNNEYYNITSPYLIKFRRNQFSRILLYPLATVRFICHCIHEKTNIVISMDDSTNLINLLSQAIGKKAIICFHVIPLLNPNIISWLNRKLLSFLIRITNPSVVVLHNRMKKEVCEAYHISNTDNVHVIHNPNQLSEIQKKSLDWIEKVNDHLKDSCGKFEGIEAKVEKNSVNTTKLLINTDRKEIIDFAIYVADESHPVTREQFNRIFKLYNEYEDIIAENGLTNGEVDISYGIIKEAYERHIKEHNFIEDINNYQI